MSFQLTIAVTFDYVNDYLVFRFAPRYYTQTFS